MKWGFTALALAVGGCSAGALPGLDNDGSVAADLRGLSCGELKAAAEQWIASHKACQVDADCTSVRTACGLEGFCGVYVNRGLEGDYFSSLVMGWNDTCGATIDCAGCPLTPDLPAGCVSGVCAPKQVAGGMVGDPCTSGLDCATGECMPFQDAKMFLGGYCTVFDCDQGRACPMGSSCASNDQGRTLCLKDCDPQVSKSQCRHEEGYNCCSGAGPPGHVGWCSPVNSLLCMAR